MHLAFIETRSQAGISAPPVTVEVHLSAGLPAFQVVGVTDAASREIRSRVRSAIVSSHLKWPDFNITINLSPSEQVKQGARFDLPIAIGLLVASNQLPRETIENREFLGELSLDGSLRPSHGALSATLSATEAKHMLCVAPDGAAQLASVPGARILAATDLLSLCAALQARKPALVKPGSGPLAPNPNYPDLSQLRGQPFLCRALELAAAGGHHLMMCGPPGVGKTLAASVLSGLLPPPQPKTQQQIWLIRDLMGLPRVSGPTFRAPHHSSSIAALIGGTARATPGEISMAHGGVLFLDEVTEFPRAVLNQLRQPLESGEITVVRAQHQHRYPARFQLVAAMNPCPCGLADSEDGGCRCSPDTIRRYRQSVSGPLTDRIDLHVNLTKPPPEQLLSPPPKRRLSARLVERIVSVQAHQHKRQGCLNRDLSGESALAVCALSAKTREHFIEAVTSLSLSARSAHRRLRVARTLADLDDMEDVTMAHLNTALSFRETPAEVGAVGG